jgi:glycosyltransferase 2 family protein
MNGSSRWARARLLLGIAISGASLALLLWNIEWGEFWAAMATADYRWLIPSLLSVLVALWLKVPKWRWLLAPVGYTSRRNVLYCMSVGYLVNTVLPGRLGELARTYLLARLERLSPVAVLSTVAVDRILDVVALSLLLAIVLPMADLPGWVTQSGLVVGAAGLSLLVLCMILARPRGQAIFLKLLGALPAFPGKAAVQGWSGALMLGLEGLRGAKGVLRIFGVTAVIWIITVSTFYFAMLAFHIQAPIWAAALALAMTNLGMVVPSSPGYIGVFHGLVVLALGAFGVGIELALGFAVVVHLIGILPVGLLGVYALWRFGLTLTGWKESVPSGDRS